MSRDIDKGHKLTARHFCNSIPDVIRWVMIKFINWINVINLITQDVLNYIYYILNHISVTILHGIFIYIIAINNLSN